MRYNGAPFSFVRKAKIMHRFKLRIDNNITCPYADKKNRECVHPRCIRMRGCECKLKPITIVKRRKEKSKCKSKD